jgi:hypothetical protein
MTADPHIETHPRPASLGPLPYIDPLYQRVGAATICPWCVWLVRPGDRATHLSGCPKKPSWISFIGGGTYV